MKFENIEVFNFKGAFRGMRNPKESWELSDSNFDDSCHYEKGFLNGAEPCTCAECKYFCGYGEPCIPYIGPKDLDLAQRLIRGGSEHRKFMRQIMVSVDITAPLYWQDSFCQ